MGSPVDARENLPLTRPDALVPSDRVLARSTAPSPLHDSDRSGNSVDARVDLSVSSCRTPAGIRKDRRQQNHNERQKHRANDRWSHQAPPPVERCNCAPERDDEVAFSRERPAPPPEILSQSPDVSSQLDPQARSRSGRREAPQLGQIATTESKNACKRRQPRTRQPEGRHEVQKNRDDPFSVRKGSTGVSGCRSMLKTAVFGPIGMEQVWNRGGAQPVANV